MADIAVPNRWMRLRRLGGFTAEDFDCFSAHTEAFVAYAQSWLRNWHRQPRAASSPTIEYVFFPPEISDDGTVVSLPIGGQTSLGTHAALENGSSFMLWQFLSMTCMEGLEEGITETIDSRFGERTNWRQPFTAISFVNANPEFRARTLRSKVAD
jgi:hypothetical protein